jgi:hypothetical protein
MGCLEKHRFDKGFTAKCAATVVENLRTASQALEMRPALAQTCEADVAKLCPDELARKAKVSGWVGGYLGGVGGCVQQGGSVG